MSDELLFTKENKIATITSILWTEFRPPLR